MSTTLTPVITNIGMTALIDAKNRGVAARITEVAVGDGNGPYTATTDMQALKNEIQRVVVAGGELFGSLQNQLHLTANVQAEGNNVPDIYPIFEIGFFLDTGELFAIYASNDEKLAEKIKGTDFVLAFDLSLTGVDAGEVIVDGSASLQMPIARDNILMGKNTVKIHTQAEFDQLFNQGENTEIPANTTIALSPIRMSEQSDLDSDETLENGATGGVGNRPHNTYNGRPGYILKNSLQVKNNVCIIGFNDEDTVVVKGNASARINIIGVPGSLISGVKFSGWSFDGRGGVNNLGGNIITNENGGAISLAFVEHCQIDCKVINHNTELSGGGIFGGEGVSKIRATQVHQNVADVGGGVFGCSLSILSVYDCQAHTRGSGVDSCHHSEIRVFNCVAERCDESTLSRDNHFTAIGIDESLVVKGEAKFESKLRFSGNLSTAAIARITPLVIRGTGDNRDGNSVLKLGNQSLYSVNDKTGLALTRINRSNHSVVGDTVFFDTASSADASDALNVALEAISNDELGVLTSHGSWSGAVSPSLKNAFKRMGLYQALSLSNQQAFRVPYAAIFEINKHSPTGGRVVESASSDNGDAYFADLNGWLMDGSFTASGSAKNVLLSSVERGGILGAYVDHNGHVGIGGTTTPEVPLDVVGDTNVAGKLKISEELTVSQNGVVDGNLTVGGELNLGGGINIDGKKPFLYKRFSGIRGATPFNTGKSTSEYFATVVGFRSFDGDIDETRFRNHKTLVQVQLFQSSNLWFIAADFKTHSTNEEAWVVDVMFIDRRLVALE